MRKELKQERNVSFHVCVGADPLPYGGNMPFICFVRRRSITNCITEMYFYCDETIESESLYCLPTSHGMSWAYSMETEMELKCTLEMCRMHSTWANDNWKTIISSFHCRERWHWLRAVLKLRTSSIGRVSFNSIRSHWARWARERNCVGYLDADDVFWANTMVYLALRH